MPRIESRPTRRCRLVLPALLLAGMKLAFAGQKVLLDTPREVVVEVTAERPRMHGGSPGMTLTLGGFGNLTQPGWPDVPAWHFQVLTGTDRPEARIEPVETELFAQGGALQALLPVTRWESLRKSVSEPDLEAYARLRAPTVVWNGIGQWRGAGMANGAVPLVWLDSERKPIGYLRRFRVRFSWPTQQARPLTLPSDMASKVLNPLGGAWQVKPVALNVQGGTSARGKRSVVTSVTLSSHVVRLRIGDREIDQFEEDGFYAIPFEQLANLLPAGTRWANVRLYTGPKDTLPARMDTLPQAFGSLRQVPYEAVDGNAPGTLDAGDTLKFYAHGTSVWKRSPEGEGPVAWDFGNDPYSFENAYFIDAGEKVGEPALRLETLVANAVSGEFTSGLAYLRAERDIATGFCDPSGKMDNEPGYAWHWFWKGTCGDGFPPVSWTANSLARPHLETLPGYAGDSVYFGFFTYPSTSSNDFELSLKGFEDTLTYKEWGNRRGAWYATRGALPDGKVEWANSVWDGRERRFDGYTVVYRRKYHFDGRPFTLFPARFGARASYRITASEPFRILKLVDGEASAIIRPAADGSFSDSLSPDADVRYFVYGAEKTLPANRIAAEDAPEPGTALADLATGEAAADALPELLIITHRSLLPAALEYKAYRSSSSRAMPMRTAVVLVQDIYRRFSGGRTTPVAIRDFIRYALNHWHPQGRLSNPLRQVMLLGDGHFDVRGVKADDAGGGQTPNLVPPYENFDNTTDALCTDDFFVKLDPEDQKWSPPGSGAPALLDLAIGRIPVRSLEEARQYLAKVKAYEDPKNGGDWRARVILTADDHIQRGAADDLDPIRQGHTNDTENLGDIIQAKEPGVLLDKVYLLDYAINATGRKPEAAQDLLDLINRGALAVNYVGHGAFNQWADEVLLYTNDALPRLRNAGRPTLLNSFSCTVGRFDNLQSDVLTEQFVRQNQTGAIAGISASRESYPGPNLALAGAVYRRIFPTRDDETLMPLGQALLEAKNSSETSDDVNDSKYNLLGDPALLMRRPKLKLGLLSFPDTLRALDCGKMVGRVEGGSGRGSVRIQILSGSVRKDYPLQSPMQEQHQEKRGSILYERTAEYLNGRFEAEYFIPKKISYGDSTAKIQIYAWDAEREAEGSLAVTRMHIQGTATGSACAIDREQTGPRIRISGCDASETGAVDFPGSVRVTLPYCFSVQIEDSSGGVVSGEGPDEGTTLEIPGVVEPFHPQPGIDNLYFKSYRYSIGKSDLKPGRYLLKVGAHDGYGNASARQLSIDVVQDTVTSSVAAYNVPNPMKRNGTTFRFSTVLPADDGEYLPVEGTVRISYQVKIHNQLGRLVRVLNQADAQGTYWDGTDAFGNRLANGVYHYVVTATYDPGDGSGKRFLSSKRNVLVISR